MVDTLRRIVTTHWVELNWQLYDWLSSPKRVSLALFLAIIVLWLGLKRQPRLRRWVSRTAIAILLLYWLIIAPITAPIITGVLVKFLPADSGRNADAIVVLTRSEDVMGDRYESAIGLWEAKRAPRLFVTSQHNLELTQTLLQARGHLPQIVSATACARTTKDEATSTAVILGSKGVKSVILLTDTPHMLRAYLTFQGVGFSVIPHPVELPPSLSAAKRSFLVVREYLSLASYAVLGRLQPQTDDALVRPPADLLQTVSDRECDLGNAAKMGVRVKQGLGSRVVAEG